jgi:hypothetical protein
VSWVVPHVLAFGGNDLGPIDAIIPASSHALDGLGSRSSVESLLQWMSRSDKEFLKARQLLANLSAETPGGLYGIMSNNSHIFQQPGWTWPGGI